MMNRYKNKKTAFRSKMQYKIPQNVQIEDKIVGPLTLRQLIYLGIGGAITYVIYNYFGSRYDIGLWILLPIFTGGLTLMFTFIQISGVSFGRWCFLMAEKLINPQKRTFIMGAGDLYEHSLFAKNTKKAQTDSKKDNKTDRDREHIKNIGQITKILDSYGKPQNT